MPLTKRQSELVNYLRQFIAERGYAPSFEEIARQFNYNSLATVHEHLSNLERKGYIKQSYNESRAIEILPSDVNPRARDLPLLGMVAAGMPDWLADAMNALFRLFADGHGSTVTRSVPDTTGHPARDYATFVRQHADWFRRVA